MELFADGLLKLGLTASVGIICSLVIISAIDSAYDSHLQSDAGDEAMVHYAEAIKRGIPHPAASLLVDDLPPSERPPSSI